VNESTQVTASSRVRGPIAAASSLEVSSPLAGRTRTPRSSSRRHGKIVAG